MKIKFPFLTTSLFTDIFWFWLLLPLWYILGVDQIIWSFAALLLTIKILILKINKNSFKIPNHIFLKSAILFLVLYILSGVFMVLLHLKPTLYVKNLLLYYAGFIFAVSIMNFKTERETLNIMKVLCFIAVVSIFVNLLAISGILNYDFQGLIEPFLPKFILKSEYITNIIHKFPFQGSERVYSLGIININRPKSIFNTANFFSGFLLLSSFFILYFFILSKNTFRKIILLSILLLAYISILTTLSRSALLGLIVSAIWFLGKHRMKPAYKIVIITLLILLAAASNYILGIQEALEERFETGSDVTRWTIYKATFREILNYPLFGHGTVMPFPGNPDIPDLGSHSTILNITFTQGIFGLILYFIMIGYIFINLQKKLRQKLNREKRILFEILFYSFIAVSIQCLFITWHYGEVYFMAIWTLWGIIIKNLSAEKEDLSYEKTN